MSIIEQTLAQHGLSSSDSLEHYGTKGMKWGVRRALQKMPAGDRTAFLAAKDAKWVAKVEAKPKLDKISRVAARDAKRQTKKLREDYKERGWNIKKDSLARTRYDTELKSILENSLDKAAYKVHKYPPSRLREISIHRHPDGTIDASIVARMNAKIVRQQGKINRADTKRANAERKAEAKRLEEQARQKAAVSHAADDDTQDAETDFDDLVFRLTVDEEGFVSDVQAPGEISGTLAHYGIKGMRWGIRRRDPSGGTPSGPEDVTVTSRAGKGARAAGGRGHMPSDDAKKAVAYRQIAKTSSVHALSNAELKLLVERLNLENNYAKLTVADRAPSKRKAFLQKIIKEESAAYLSGNKTPRVKLVQMIVAAGRGAGYAGTHGANDYVGKRRAK